VSETLLKPAEITTFGLSDKDNKNLWANKVMFPGKAGCWHIVEISHRRNLNLDPNC
jgi:hypothetical protein